MFSNHLQENVFCGLHKDSFCIFRFWNIIETTNRRILGEESDLAIYVRLNQRSPSQPTDSQLMTVHNLPQISALRAFEAAARRMSFTRAAEELHVTQAAVSYQVRQLEQVIGVKLFQRLHRNLILTDAARAYLPIVRQALDLLSKGTTQLKRPKFDGLLKVSASQSLTPRWLAHRIRRFSADFPEYDIRIDATDDLVDFAHGDIDLAIRYSQKIDPTLESILLSTDRVFPVCSPKLADESQLLQTPLDLSRHTLLHDEMTDIRWRNWLAAAGADDVDADSGVQFSHSGLTADAAIAGQGVALGRSLLVADDLTSGRLVRPFDLALTSSYAYFVVYPPASADLPKIQSFRDWLLVEARTSERASLLRELA
jgi:LysR family glycine cleavage system transcriptional activator